MEAPGEINIPNPESTPFKLVSFADTHSRDPMNEEANEDGFINRPESGIFVVLDGVGGRAGGKLCSQTAGDYLNRTLPTLAYATPEQIKSKLPEIIQKTSDEVSKATGGAKAGTTASICIVTGNKAIVAVVGDSPVYQIRNQELVWVSGIQSYEIIKVVKERGLTGESARNEERRISRLLANVKTYSDYLELNPQEQRCYSRRNVLSDALGLSAKHSPQADIYELDIEDGDYIALLTDGISDPLTESEILRTITDEYVIDKAKGLTKAAEEALWNVMQDKMRLPAQRKVFRADHSDDKTAIVVKVKSATEEEALPKERSKAKDPKDRDKAIRDFLIKNYFKPQYDSESRSFQEARKPDLIADNILWQAHDGKRNLLKARLAQSFDLSGRSRVEVVGGRFVFPDMVPRLGFDPQKLLIGILAGDHTDDATLQTDQFMVKIYYPHISEGELVAKTEFRLTFQDALELLIKCAKQLELPLKSLHQSLLKINMRSLHGVQSEKIHKNGIYYSLENALDRQLRGYNS